MNVTIHRTRRFHRALCAALTLGALASTVASCSDEAAAPPPAKAPNPCGESMNTSPTGDPWKPADDPAAPVTASFKVTLDPAHAAFMTEQREPLSAPLTLEVVSGDLKIWGGVKRFVKHPERLYLELYFINDTKTGMKDATATVKDAVGSAAFYDFNTDPWAAPTTETTMLLGGIAPEGVGRIQFGFDADAANSPIMFTLDVAGTTTTRVSTSSTPVQVTPDGKEAWAVFADGDALSVIDTATDQRLDALEMKGRPSSVAITPDGALVLTACSSCNQLKVIDRATRKVTQIFGETEGIGRDPRNVVISPDGTRAYVSSYVGDSVTALERVGDAFRVLKEIPVGRRPVGMSVTPDGKTVLVAHFMPRGKIEENEGWVSIIDADALAVAGDAALADDANVGPAECLRKVSGFDVWTAEQLSFEASPTQLAGAFLTPGGDTAWAPGLRASGFPIFEGKVENAGFTFVKKGANSPSMLFAIDTKDARHAKGMRYKGVIDVADRAEDYLRCVPFIEEAEGVSTLTGATADEIVIPGVTLPDISTFLAETGVARFVGYSRGGRRALILSYVADELIVMDAPTHSPTSRHHLTLSGSNPIGIAVTPDGKKGYVAYESSTFLSAVDLSAYASDAGLPSPQFVPYRLGTDGMGQGAALVTSRLLTRNVKDVPDALPVHEVAKAPLVDSDPMDPVRRRGKVLFNSSNHEKYPTLTERNQASCAACHPDGGNDGTIWSTMEGERRTMGLWGGVAGKGWLHSSGTHHNITDFTTIIVKERLGGTGLSDADQRALSDYAAHGIPEVQRPAVNAALAEKGKAIFTQRCVSCHAGDRYSSGNPSATDEFGGGAEPGPALYNVGSSTDWAHAIPGDAFANLFPGTSKTIMLALQGDRALGQGDEVQAILEYTARPDRKRGELKAPSLVNTWENVLFFHDGRASSLEDAVKDIAARTGEALSDADAKAVTEYLKTL